MVDCRRILLGIAQRMRGRAMSFDSVGAWSCADTCRLSKSTPVLVAVFLSEHELTADQEFECGNCTCRDLWKISEMLWDTENEFLVTPCCHGEASHFLDMEYAKQDEYDQSREDYQNYVYAVTGR